MGDKKKKVQNFDRPVQKKQQDIVNNITVYSKDFYRKMNEQSSKGLLMKSLNQVIKDHKVIKQKILNKVFLVGTYIKNKDDKKKKIKKSKNKNFQLPKNQIDYKSIAFLNKTWEEYIFELILNDKSEEAILQKILKSDFHGAIVEVKESINQKLIGLKGLVIKETQYTFQIITQKNQLKIIQKNICNFRIFLREKTIHIYGPLLTKKLEERLKNKYKVNPSYLLCKNLIKIIKQFKRQNKEFKNKTIQLKRVPFFI